jgi:DNA-binding CsgD family transcriptional regulator
VQCRSWQDTNLTNERTWPNQLADSEIPNRTRTIISTTNHPDQKLIKNRASLWNQLIETCIACLGEEIFFENLCDELQNIINLDKANMIIAYPCNNRPIVLAHSLTKKDISPHIEHYLNGLYLLDPFYQASSQGMPSGFYQLEDVAPDGFYQTEFFKRYYKAGNITDDLGYCFAVEDIDSQSDYIHISFACTSDEEFDQRQLDELKAMESVIRELVLKQLHLTDNKVLLKRDSTLHGQLMKIMNEFGSSILTNREREVLQMILHGHSSQGIAVKLGIALRTVKLHRQNLYRKLDITTQAELFYLFIDSLSCIDGTRGHDPLVSYLQAPS